MRKVEIIDPLHDPRWDAFVACHPFGWIYHLSAWKQVLEESFAHIKGCYLALTEGADIKAALPLFAVRSWLTGKRLVSIPFATLSDPLISTSNDMTELLDAAIELLNETGASTIRITTLESPPLITDARMSRTLFYKNHYLELEDDAEQLMSSFHSSAVRMIKKIGKSGMYSLATAKDLSGLQCFYRLYAETRRHLGLPLTPYSFFESLWNAFFPKDMLTLLFAKHKNEPVAGHIYLKFKKRVSMEFEAWDRRFHTWGPNHYLFWEEIKLARSEGLRIIDFGRTSFTNTGLMRFKGLWGTKVVDLPQFHYPGTSDGMSKNREESLSYKIIRMLCRHSSPGASKYIGKFCYRHLG